MPTPAPVPEPCARCAGSGRAPTLAMCMYCAGTGAVRTAIGLEALILDMAPEDKTHLDYRFIDSRQAWEHGE